MKKIFKNKLSKLALLLALSVLAFNVAAYAEIPPVDAAVQTETNAQKLKLKAPIAEEISDETSASEDAKIKEELNEAQKTIGEATPLTIEDKEFDPIGNDALSKEVVPNTGHELMMLISMFAKVMLAVLASCVIIYFLLIFTRKFFHPPLPEKGEEDFDVRDLNSPKSMDEALKAFLDRTDE